MSVNHIYTKYPQMLYVDVPSPYPTACRNSSRATGPLADPSARTTIPNTGHQKENNHLSQQPFASSSRKRNSSATDISETINAAKRPKLGSSVLRPALSHKQELPSARVASAENRVISFYCHQCSKKRDATECVQCTYNGTSRGRKNIACHMKYCRQCLTNRYGESPNGTYNTSGGEPGAIGSRDKTYKCPRCRDICNCWRCRRAKGLEPAGNMKTTTGRTTDNALITPFTTPGTKKVSPVSLRDTGESFAGTPNRKSLSIDIIRDPAPSPQWTRAANKFTFEDGAARFTIREFILRFSSAMEPNISNTHLDEIDHIFGSWNTNDYETLPAWISEACVKSIVTSLLGLIGSDSEANVVETKYIEDTVKQLRVAGDNLSKIWTILSSLQNNAAGSCSTRISQSLGNLPRPLPPPESCKRRTTRSISQTSIQILHSIQFMPIISALVNLAIETVPVRKALESGAREEKELTRSARELCRKEKEQYEQSKQDLAAKFQDKMKSKEYMKQVKAIREAHNHALGDFEMALEVAAHRFASRYCSLGNDMDGRTYWVLSPGPMEIEHARKIITGGAAWNNASMKQSNCRQSDRVLAKDWTWCVAVWGTAPTHVDTTGDEESHWWIFSEPAEIRKLALWVSNNPGPTPRTIECAGVTVDGLRNLTNGLNRYANILDWRLQNSSRWL